MMFLAPLFFYIGLGVAGGAIAMHFIVTRQPPSNPLPTARFVPEGSVLVTTVAEPTNLLLLLLRVLLAITIGAAFARPIVLPRRRPVARIVVADVSRAVGTIEAVRDSVRGLLQDGDILIVFDSTARVIERSGRDSVATMTVSNRQGRLSAALIMALRSASRLRATADSLRLVIVSPLRASEIDGATLAIRKLWPGRIQLAHVPAKADSLATSDGGAVVRAGSNDLIVLAAGINGLIRTNAAVRIVRQAATVDDSIWAIQGRHTLVRWPTNGPPSELQWVAHTKGDTVGAVVVGATALVFPFERRWRLTPAAHFTHVAARWIDGEPAAVESVVGNGCIRDVAVSVPARGDLILRPGFARLLEALAAPCAMTSIGPAADAQMLASLAGSGPMAAAASIATPEMSVTPLMPWLLAFALAMALGELVARRKAI